MDLLSVIRRWRFRDKLPIREIDRLTHHCHILETGNDSFRFKASAASGKQKKETVQTLTKTETRGR